MAGVGHPVESGWELAGEMVDGVGDGQGLVEVQRAGDEARGGGGAGQDPRAR